MKTSQRLEEEALRSPLEFSLAQTKSGTVIKDMANVMVALDIMYKDRLRYNLFRRQVELDAKELEENDLSKVTYELQTTAGMRGVARNVVYDAVNYYAHTHEYDEAVDWLNSLVWDNTPRLETWLIRTTGVEDDADKYHRAIGSQWFMGLIRRLIEPGCIFDNVLVVVGPQRTGKTSMFRIIGGDWYKSFTGSVDNKDFYMALRGAAVVDLDEGVALYKSESIKIKSIITTTHDEYRAPYDRVTQRHPRRFVFSMSTNDTEPFRDITGNRRYWTVDIKNIIDFEWLEENRDQLYAEAYHCVKNNIILPEVPEHIANEHQEYHLSQDSWTETIMKYIQHKEETTITDIYLNAVCDDQSGSSRIDKLDKRTEMRIADILKREKWEKKRYMEDNHRIVRWTNPSAAIPKQDVLTEW